MIKYKDITDYTDLNTFIIKPQSQQIQNIVSGALKCTQNVTRKVNLFITNS